MNTSSDLSASGRRLGVEDELQQRRGRLVEAKHDDPAAALDDDQPPVARLRPLWRAPLDRIAAAPRGRHRYRHRAVVTELPERAGPCSGGAGREPRDRVLDVRALGAAGERVADHVERVAAAALVRLGSRAPAGEHRHLTRRQLRQRALGLGERAGRAQQLHDPEPLAARLDRHREHAPGAGALGHAAQACRRRVERGKLAAALVDRDPGALELGRERRRRRGHGARHEPPRGAVGEPQHDGVGARAGGERVGERSQPFVQAGGPGEAPFAPFWIDHCP